MTNSEIREFIERWRRAWLQQDLDGMVEFYAEEAVVASPIFGTLQGKAQIRASFENLFRMFRDTSLDIEDVLIDRDGPERVVLTLALRSTSRGKIFEIPSTGTETELRGAFVWTFQNGRILSEKRVYSLQGVTQTLERARMEMELRVASDVQSALLPRTRLTGDFFETAGASIACRAIGGDFFEYADLSSSEVGVVLGDVSGKGPAAALLASMLQGMFSVESRIGGSPSGVLQRMNRRLVQRHIEPRFATLVYGVLSRDGQFVYSNAGHNPPFLLRAGEVRHLRTGGPILGVFSNAVFSEETLSLEKGDTIVLFTDGVTEAFDAAGEDFGEQRLISCVTARENSPSELVASVFSAVKEFCRDSPQSDDLTMTVIRFQ